MASDMSTLRDPLFRRLYLARTLSLTGTSMAPLALTFAVLDLPGNSATNLGLVLGARTVAALVFVLLGGAVADRFPRARLMVGSDFLSFIAQAATAAMVLVGDPPLLALIAASAVAGASEAVFGPAIRGIIPQVVPDDKRQSANALLRLSRSSTAVLGAPLAGVLIAVWSPGVALAVDAGTFLVSSALLVGLHIPKVVATSDESMLKDLLNGWQEFRSRQWVWVVVAQFAVVNLCFAPSIFVLGPILAEDYMGGATPWSFILAANALGLVSGALVAMRIRPQFPMRLATLFTFGFLPPLALLALQTPVWLVALSLCINGICADIFEVLWETSLQDHIPAESLSRVSSYDMLGSFALGPIGMVLVGPVSATIGITQTLVAAGTAMALANAAAFAAPGVRRLRSRTAQAEDLDASRAVA